MKLTKNIQSFLYGSVGAVGGIVGILLILGVINRPELRPSNRQLERVTSFEVKEVSKKKITVRKKKRQAPKKSLAKRLSPQLSSSLLGQSFGLEQFQNLDIDESLLGNVNNVAMTEDTVDNAPKPYYRFPPEYPEKAYEKGIEGYVILNLLINTRGEVEAAKVLESGPNGVFDGVALASIGQWKFRPALYNGKNVKVWAKQKITFSLN